MTNWFNEAFIYTENKHNEMKENIGAEHMMMMVMMMLMMTMTTMIIWCIWFTLILLLVFAAV